MSQESRPRAAMQTEEITKPLDFRGKIRTIKLRTALENLEAGRVNTATEQLLELYKERPMTPEGNQAATALTDLANFYETNGKTRLAIDLLEKLSESP
jgi:hypothetical protein